MCNHKWPVQTQLLLHTARKIIDLDRQAFWKASKQAQISDTNRMRAASNTHTEGKHAVWLGCCICVTARCGQPKALPPTRAFSNGQDDSKTGYQPDIAAWKCCARVIITSIDINWSFSPSPTCPRCDAVERRLWAPPRGYPYLIDTCATAMMGKCRNYLEIRSLVH